MDGLISYVLAKGMYISNVTGISDIRLDGRDLVFEMSDGKQLRVGMGSVVDGLNGKSLEFDWKGTKLGVRVEGDTSFTYVDLKGKDGIDGINGRDGVDGRDGRDGIDGINGREIELSKENGYIRWRYVGDVNWINLMPISDLGVSDGKNLEFNWSGTRLGVRVEGDTNYSYVDLKGDTGKNGTNGKNGADGADGIDGREVEFIIDNGYLKWRYVGEVNWIELLDLSTLNNGNNTWENF